jgi:hypothetical protein
MVMTYERGLTRLLKKQVSEFHLADDLAAGTVASKSLRKLVKLYNDVVSIETLVIRRIRNVQQCRNENWQERPKYSEKTCPSATLFATNPT